MGAGLPAVAQVIHKLGCFGRFNAAMDQRQDDFIVGPLVNPQLGGQVDIRLQNVVCRACGKLIYRQTSSDTSRQLREAVKRDA